MKAVARAARAEVVTAELLEQLLVAVQDAEPAPHMRFGRVTPSSACYSARKEGRLSKSSSCRRMTCLLSPVIGRA